MKSTSTLFIDESGKSSLADKKDEPFVLTGIIIDDEDLKNIEGFFNYIKRRFGLDDSLPFHSYEVFEKTDTRLSPAKIEALILMLKDFISLIPIKINIVKTDKLLFKKALGVNSEDDFKGDSKKKEVKEFPYKIMASILFSWFADHLDGNNKIGQVMADSRRAGDHELLKAFEMCKDLNGPLKEKNRNLIRQRVCAICFAEKYYLSGGLEIIDVISFVTFNSYKRNLSNFGTKKMYDFSKEIKNKSKIIEITESEVRRFFRVPKDGVHKYLKK